jgi:hypothetical protein
MTMTALDRALVTGDAGRMADESPDPGVPEKARHRRFTAQYKLDVVAEYDAAPSGEKGAVLRREGWPRRNDCANCSWRRRAWDRSVAGAP